MTATPSLREAAQMALDTLELRCGTNADERRELIPSLRAALTLPDAEPDAWRISYTGADGVQYRRLFGHNAIGDYRVIDPAATSTPLYAAPQTAPVERKPLTALQVNALPVWNSFIGLCFDHREEIARAIEQAHNIQGAA